MRNVYGLDLSLTCTGVAGFNLDTGELVDSYLVRSIPHDRTLRGMQLRVARIIAEVVRPLTEPGLVVIESPAYGSRMGSAVERNGLYMLAVHVLLSRGFEVAPCPPATRAKYAAGHGRATKTDVLDNMQRALGFRARTDDEADALALAALGCRALGRSVENDDVLPPELLAKKAEVAKKFGAVLQKEVRHLSLSERIKNS